ncbi:MAG: preprotein translocase subunit SecE [Actinomycetota bacterium]|nr:preprotein translocase subunit SecE [Actinomycetota bacterium]
MTETRPASSSQDRRAAPRRTTLPVFYRQVVAELRKVVWPTRHQLLTYFVVVLVFVLVMIGIVSALDYAFGSLMFNVFA